MEQTIRLIVDTCTQCVLYELPDTSSKEWCVYMDGLSQVNSDPADGEIYLLSKHVFHQWKLNCLGGFLIEVNVSMMWN